MGLRSCGGRQGIQRNSQDCSCMGFDACCSTWGLYYFACGVPSQNSGKKWGFPRFAGDCANGNRKSLLGTISEQKNDIRDSCSQMILQLHDVYDPNKVNVKIKIVYGSPCGSVAVEAKNAQASWVVLDKHLKQRKNAAWMSCSATLSL
ncbi:hypothetical protein F8388_023927 [Cannabis sativa]|uniref:Uncharacterized protein n=1 Tax=Cannabis sativa TaxID=3483 RepID=A0A7J6EUP0_CANSA|nr:hypothetical protein F8388_023927 [Cannabis sativa]